MAVFSHRCLIPKMSELKNKNKNDRLRINLAADATEHRADLLDLHDGGVGGGALPGGLSAGRVSHHGQRQRGQPLEEGLGLHGAHHPLRDRLQPTQVSGVQGLLPVGDGGGLGRGM